MTGSAEVMKESHAQMICDPINFIQSVSRLPPPHKFTSYNTYNLQGTPVDPGESAYVGPRLREKEKGFWGDAGDHFNTYPSHGLSEIDSWQFHLKNGPSDEMGDPQRSKLFADPCKCRS